MQREACPVIVELEIGEGDIADDGVNAVLGQARIAEVFDADVVAGVERAGHPSREVIQFHADEAHAFRGVGQEVPDAKPGSSTRASGSTPRRANAACMAWMTMGEV